MELAAGLGKVCVPVRVASLEITQAPSLIEAGWDELSRASAERHPFLEWPWFLLCLRHLCPSAEPYALAADDGSQLVGLWPLVAEEWRWLCGARALTFPGASLADYQGLLVRDGAREVVEGFAAYLARQDDWDVLWMADLPSDHWSTQTLLSALRTVGLTVTTVPALVSPYVPITEPWPDYYRKTRSSGARKNLRWSLRKLQERGVVAFRHYTEAHAVAQVLEDTFRIHQARWFDRFTTTPYSRSASSAFFGDLAVAYAERGLLDLATLELDGRPIAFSFSFTYPGRYFYYIPAFDPDYRAYSPGTVLMVHLMERAFEQGYAVFDFMKGDEAYKLQWTSTCRTSVGLLVANRTWRGYAALRAIAAYRRLRWRARQSAAIRGLRREGLGRILGWMKRIGGRKPGRVG